MTTSASTSANSSFDWGGFLLNLVDQFVITPREQMEHEAQLARARADEALASAQLAAMSARGQTMNMLLVGAAILGVGLLAVGAMK